MSPAADSDAVKSGTSRADAGASGAGRPGDGTPPAAPDRWTVLSLIRWSADYLAAKGVPDGRLDAEHLLAHSLDRPRLQLYLEFDRPMTPEELAEFKPLLLRRAGREPLQYIVGRTGFRELELRTDRRALIPRPETEVLVEVVLDHFRGRTGLTALDIGTGTGCIALSLAQEGGFEDVFGVDVSADAIELARENAASTGLGERVHFGQGSLYDAVAQEKRFDAVVSNPPYVAEGDRDGLQAEVRDWEPEGALFAGERGLAVFEPLIDGAPAHLVPGGMLALEIGVGQAAAVGALIDATGAFGRPTTHRDWSGKPRIVSAIREG